MREGYRHPARISPDIEHLHHHRWDLLEEERRGEESRRAEREKVKEREAEGKEVRGKGRGRERSQRDRVL